MGSKTDCRITGMVFIIIIMSLIVLVNAAPPSLSGVVARFNGTPIEGVNVSLYNSSDGSFVSSNLTDSDGTYFVDLSDGDTYHVIFNKTGFIFRNDTYRNMTITIGGAEDMTLNTSLYPDNHGSYNFTVYNLATGLGIEGVNITITASTGEIENGTTNTDGIALIQIIANNSDFNVSHNITISKSGHKSQTLTDYIMNEGFNENHAVYLDNYRNISGKVTRFNNNNISSINVSVYNLSTGNFLASGITDSFGNYFINLPVWGDCFVIFNGSISGLDAYIYGTDNYRNYTITIGPNDASILNASLYFKSYGSYNLTVRDTWNGRLLQGANVTIYPSGNPSVSGITDENGNILLEVIANSTENAGVLHNISIVLAGYKSDMIYSHSIIEGTNEDISINLTGACEIHGEISDSENNLLAPMIEDAYLELWDNLNTYRVGFGGDHYYSTYSSASGQYLLNYPSTLPGTLNCSAYLHVNASGYVSRNNILIESSIIKDINLTGSAYVSGNIVDASNVSHLIQGALIRIINNGSTMHQLYSDSSGMFNISVRDSVNHTIEISIPDYAIYTNSTIYNTSIDYGTISLYGLGILNGTLMDETNNSILLDGVDVKIASTSNIYSTTTDSSGQFGIIVKDNTQYDISFELNGYFDNSTVQQVLNETDIGTVTLRGKNQVHGIVTDSDNLQNIHVNGTKVELISQIDTKRYTTYTDGNGAYSFYVSSMINDYLMRFDKAGYNVSLTNYSMINNALINANLIGATHIEGTVEDVYSPVAAEISSVLIEVIDENDTVHYNTLSDIGGHYSFDIGIDFNYTLKATKDGYQEERITNLPWDHDRSGTGGADRIQDIFMNGTISVYVRTIDGFDNMDIDNSLVCVLYGPSYSDCFYVKTTGDEGDVRFNIHSNDYRLKITRDGYPQAFRPSESGSLNGDFSGNVTLEAYAEIYVYDNYALNNEDIYLATIELYTYNNQTDFAYNLNETLVNITAACNGVQRDNMNVTLVGITHPYYSSQNTVGGSPLVSFRTVPTGYHNLIIDGTAFGCGHYEETINVISGGVTYTQDYDTDTVPPSFLSLTESADPLEFGSSVTVSIDAIDSQNPIDTVLIEVYGTNRTMTAVSGDTYQYAWSPTAVGVVAYTIYANDTWNNINQTSGSITVQDTTAPVVTLVSPDDQLFYTDSVTFTYNVNDLSAIQNCELWTNTTGTWTLNMGNTSTITVPGPNTFNMSSIGDGNYIWNVNCTDTSSNDDFSSANYVFTVDESTPILTIASPENKSYSSGDVMFFNISSNKALVSADYSINGGANITMYSTSITQFYGLQFLMSDGTYNVMFYGLGYNGKIGATGSRTFSVDSVNPNVTSVDPANESIFVEIATVGFTIDADESVNLTIVYWNDSGLWTATNASYVPNPWAASAGLANDTYLWNYTVCDPAGNCVSSGNFTFDVLPAPASITVYVNDTTANNPVGANSNGDGVNVRISNATYSETKNTTDVGYVIFTGLCDDEYDISVNGTMQGYGMNSIVDYALTGDIKTTILLNITRLTVNVTDALFAPVADANITVYESDDTTIAKDAAGNNLVAQSGASGIIVFNRALPCNNCNVSVRKNTSGMTYENSTPVNIIAGNLSNYAWVDPPQSISHTFDLNFTLNSDIVPVGVTVSIRDYNSSVIRWSNTTDANGNTIIYNIPSGVYDFIIDGEAVGYSKDIHYANSVGVIIQNTDATNINGRVKININGLFTYYVAVSANGYNQHDDLLVNSPRVGTYDDSINTTGISPMIQLGLDGNTTLSGYVYDTNFKTPMNLSYEPISNVTLSVYTTTSCEVIPSPALLRYRAVSAENGIYSMIVSPVQQSDPSATQDYCANVTASGFISDNANDINVYNNLNVGLTGDGIVSGYIRSQDNNTFLGEATILLRSSQCYGGLSGPVAQCSAYEKISDATGYFSFNVNSRSSNPSYVPYSVRITKNGYTIFNDGVISALPSIGNYFYLAPATMSTINVTVTSEFSEYISDNVTLKFENNDITVTESDCILLGNVFVCNINNGVYDLTVNGTFIGYDYYYESGVILIGQTIEKNIVLNITKANITLFDDNGQPVSGVNITINSVPTITNTTVDGSALFYKVLPGTHTLSFTGLADYLGVSNSTIDIVNIGSTNTKTLYANETQFYVNISNGTAGIENISMTIGGLFNITNSTGEILFDKVNNSLSGTYFVEFNRTDIYLRGYIAPYPNISVNVSAGLDRMSGNNLTVILNRTNGYGILRVNTNLNGVNVSLWHNNTDYIDQQICGSDGFAFLHTNISSYNSSLYIRAEMEGYNNETIGPYNATDGNITYIDVTMTSTYSNCAHGAITTTCLCSGAPYSFGYCCSGSYQTTTCDVGYNPGGGSSSTSSGSSPGGVTIIDDPIETTEEVYNFSIHAGDYYIFNIAKDGSGCVNIPVRISNTGNTILNNIDMKISNLSSVFSADFDPFTIVLYPHDETFLVVRICSSDSVIRKADYEFKLSVSSGNVSRSASITLRAIPKSDDTLSRLKERHEKQGSILFDINVSSLTPELKEYYDTAMRNLKDAEDYMESGNYEQAGHSLDEAERNIQLLLDGIDDVPPVIEDSINWYILGAVAFTLAILSGLLYWFFLRKRNIFSKEPILPWDLSAKTPVLKLPKIDFSSIKVPTALLKVMGKHDVYYTHSMKKKRYLTDIIEKVLELKCPKCGGKIYQNRCVWCGYKINASLRMDNAKATPKKDDDDKSFRQVTKSNVYYTHRSQKSNGVSDRFVTDDIEQVIEKKCSKCGGKIYAGKCIWCK